MSARTRRYTRFRFYTRLFPAPTPDMAWLCWCGNYEESGLHCSCCGNQPPWGCDCALCDDERYSDVDDGDDYYHSDGYDPYLD